MQCCQPIDTRNIYNTLSFSKARSLLYSRIFSLSLSRGLSGLLYTQKRSELKRNDEKHELWHRVFLDLIIKRPQTMGVCQVSFIIIWPLILTHAHTQAVTQTPAHTHTFRLTWSLSKLSPRLRILNIRGRHQHNIFKVFPFCAHCLIFNHKFNAWFSKCSKNRLCLFFWVFNLFSLSIERHVRCSQLWLTWDV